MCSTIIDNSNSDVININRENLLALYVCLKNRLINLKASLESEPEPKVGRASVCLCRQTCYYCCQCRRRSLSLRSAEMSLVTRGRHRCLVVTSARLRPWLAPHSVSRSADHWRSGGRRYRTDTGQQPGAGERLRESQSRHLVTFRRSYFVACEQHINHSDSIIEGGDYNCFVLSKVLPYVYVYVRFWLLSGPVHCSDRWIITSPITNHPSSWWGMPRITGTVHLI